MLNNSIFIKIKRVFFVSGYYRKWLFLAMLCPFILLSPLHAQNFPLRFNHLTVDEGLSHTDSKDIKQDGLGFIWFGTLFGLDRYDGYQIRKFYNNNDPQNNAFKNRIKGVFPDKNGRIWLATDDGIQCFDSKSEKYIDFSQGEYLYSYSSVFVLKNDILLASCNNKIKLFKIRGSSLAPINISFLNTLVVKNFVTDDDENVWLATDSGIWKLDVHLQITSVRLDKAIKGKFFSRIYLNNDKNLVLISGDVIMVASQIVDRNIPKSDGPLQFHFIAQLSLAQSGSIKDIIQDQGGRYWVSTDNCLLTLDSHLKILSSTTIKSGINGLTSNSLDKLFIDRSQCLWICTFGGGVDFTDLNAKAFFTFQHNPELTNTLSGNHIRAILEDSKNSLWIGTNANGLNHYSFATKRFTLYNSVSSPIKLKSEQINALALDKKRYLWIGENNGIQILNGKLQKLEMPNGYRSFPTYDVENIATDINGNIWFGSYEHGLGCIKWNTNAEKYETKYFNGGKLQETPVNDLISFIYTDVNKPELFIGTSHGMIRLLLNSESEIKKVYRYYVNGKSNSLSSNYIWPIQRQNDTLLWVGTLGGGLDAITLKTNGNYSVKSYYGKNGIFNDVESLQIDSHNNIWMGGNGLEQFDPKNHLLTKYNKNDGLQGNSFKVSSSFKGADGKLYFGGINGLNYFYPDSIKMNKIRAKPALTDLVVNNQHVNINENSSNTSPLQQTIAYTSNLHLNYLQNNFIIYFSSMHFANSVKCLYRYRLEGYDKGWKYTDGTNPSAAYSNLNFDSYKFIVESTNNDGVWSSDTAYVNVTITPPWWKSNMAYFLYGFFLLLFLFGIYIYQARWFRLKREYALRGLEELKREELHQQQLHFFTNISHEFRTPLTLILGPLENMLKEDNGTVYYHNYQVMYRNARRLMNLINELMNFRKIAESAIKLHVANVNLSQFINELAEEFSELAKTKQINFSVIQPENKIENWVDFHILEKILFNLLNNAFKYTANGGGITFELLQNLDAFKPAYENFTTLESDEKADSYVYFKVTDTGIGISKESIGYIFDRYYRISEAHLGSGVGLSLVKSLTLLHKGNITVYSERYKGTEIIIALPCGEKWYSDAEKWPEKKDTPIIKLEKTEPIMLPPENTVNFATIGDYNSRLYDQHILIVEDNDELRQFIYTSLKHYYHISEAVNGQDGLEKAIEKIPDLIISDVMMPIMNGNEFCRQIRDTIETSHIPFMMLTAKDALDARLEGAGSGADYYFSKPVSVDLLLITIHNIFDQRQKLKEKYIKDYYSEATQLVQSEKDKQFIEKLLCLINNQIANPDLDIDYLCQHLFLSRTKLCDKIKNISGQPPGEFIRTIRLKRAIHIMTHEDAILSEVVERIGIQSKSYFTKAFKKEFGTTPSQFLQSIKKEGNNI